MTGFRLDRGGLIDRSAPLEFTFDGGAFTGFAGDTLASALIANDVHLMGRSFNDCPRGVISAAVPSQMRWWNCARDHARRPTRGPR